MTKLDFSQDDVVEKNMPDPNAVIKSPKVNSTELRGYFGKSNQQGYWRLYSNSSLKEYVDIEEGDIIDKQTNTTGNDKQTALFVKPDAVLLYTRIATPVQAQAAFIMRNMPQIPPRPMNPSFGEWMDKYNDAKGIAKDWAQNAYDFGYDLGGGGGGGYRTWLGRMMMN